MIRIACFFLIFFIVLGSGCKSDRPSNESLTAETSDVSDMENSSTKESKTAVTDLEDSNLESKESVVTLEPSKVKPEPEKKPAPKKSKPKPKPKAKKLDAEKSVVKAQPSKVVAPNETTESQTFARVYFHKTIHEFGEIDEGDKITAKFKFTNTGKTPLTIDNVDVSCGCTMPTFPIMPIGPGENGEIGVIYDSKGKFGTQKPTLTVKTNAVQPITKLYLSGSIKHVFEKVKSDSTTVESDSTSIER